jgi:lysyl-tRNA synthetase, class II
LIVYNHFIQNKPSTQPIETIRQEKIRKLEELISKGHQPYLAAVKFHPIPISQAKQNEVGKQIAVAGRIQSVRGHGGIRFLDLKDASGKIQAAAKLDQLGEDKFSIFNLLDAGDFLEVTGELFITNAGELTIQIHDYTILSKAIRPLPDPHEGLTDKEVRYRKRYLDLQINPEVETIFKTRHRLVRYIREFLNTNEFTEVETPILQPLYGGANARPFETSIHALDNAQAYLRIAPELYLKRLVVGGIERVYEIARDFRNEGIDQTHFPEFTMLEAYFSFGGYQEMMDLMEAMMRSLSERLEIQNVSVGEISINLKKEWLRIPMTDLIKQYLDQDISDWDQAKLIQFAQENKLETSAAMQRGELIFLIFDKLISSKLIDPTWVIDYPVEISPLSKNNPNKPGYAERFELYIGGVEIMDGWTEVIDPLEQRRRFEAESYRSLDTSETAQPVDEDFLEAMEYGMPPMAGVGVGIDRLTMFFTNTWSIQETILFPFKRPISTDETVQPPINQEDNKHVHPKAKNTSK